jgi:hypothetical protein
MAFGCSEINRRPRPMAAIGRCVRQTHDVAVSMSSALISALAVGIRSHFDTKFQFFGQLLVRSIDILSPASPPPCRLLHARFSAISTRPLPKQTNTAQPVAFFCSPAAPPADDYFFGLFSLPVLLLPFSPSSPFSSHICPYRHLRVQYTPFLSHSPSVSKKDSPVLVFLHSSVRTTRSPGESLKLATWTLKRASRSL